MLLHHLREHYKFVVDAFSLLPLLHALRSKIDEVLTLDFIDTCLGAELLERFQNWTVGSKCSKTAVVLHVLLVAVECCRHSRALRSNFYDLTRVRDDAVLHRGKFGLLYAALFRGVLWVWTDRLAVPLPLIPPLNEIAALRVIFLLTVYEDTILPYPALGVEKNGSKSPLVIDFDLLEELYAGRSWHLGGSLDEPPVESPIITLNASK